MSNCLSQIPYKLNNKIKNNNIVNEEHHYPNQLEKKGITSILSSEFTQFSTTTQNNSKPINNIHNNSIRRTMSLDMSSNNKWDKQDGFSLKRVKSIEDLQSFREEKNDNKENLSGGAFEDIWSSILLQKKHDETESSDTVPYVHPLVKRTSSLSEKSLEICTESLGSETGSDGFSNPSPNNNEDDQEQDEIEIEIEIKHDEIVLNKIDYYHVSSNKKVNNNYNNNVGVKRSFPPPLPSLSYRDDGSNFHMRSRREDGRLVVDAVSLNSRKLFNSCREDGRLVLTIANVGDRQNEEDERGAGEDVEEFEFGLLSGRPKMAEMVNVNRGRGPPSPMIMSKFLKVSSDRYGFKSIWPRASNMTIINRSMEVEEEEEEEPVKQRKMVGARSLPPRPKVSRATSAADVLNVYEYYWRSNYNTSSAAVAVLTPLVGKQNNFSDFAVSPQVVKDNKNKRMMNKFILEHNIKEAITQDEVEKEEYLVPYLRGCKEHKRSSLLFWEQYCIPTS